MLAVGMAVALLLWQRTAIFNWAFASYIRSYSLISATEKVVAQKQDEVLAIAQAQKKMREWKEHSLPPDEKATPKSKPSAHNGQRLYQEWIARLAELSGWDNVRVTPQNTSTSRNNVYLSVPMKVEAEARFSQLCQFLHHFHRTDLVQRVRMLEVKSTESEGDPVLRITIDCEALALIEAPVRKTLFPQTALRATVDDSATSVAFASAKTFPAKPPYLVRIGTEFLRVTAVNGDSATVIRGADGTKRVEHPAGATVEMQPINPQAPAYSEARYREMIASNAFIKPQPPVPYKLKPPALGEKVLVKGQSLDITVPAVGYDPALGKPQFSLGNAVPEGMKLDGATGKLSWKPALDYPAGKVTVSVTIRHPSADDGIVRGELVIAVKEANKPPTIVADTVPVAVLGRAWKLPITVKDSETPAEKLMIRIGAGGPEGLTVDAKDMALVWTPTDAALPGDYPITVTVSDDGNPPLTANKIVTIKLEDDRAAFTYLVGVIRKDGQWEAMLTDRLQNKTTVVRVGDAIEISDIRGTVAEIKPRLVVLKQGESLTQVELGEALREMKPVAEPKKES